MYGYRVSDRSQPNSITPPKFDIAVTATVDMAPGVRAWETASTSTVVDDVTLTFTVRAIPGDGERAGRFVCASIAADAGLSGELVRRIPVAAIVHSAAAHLLMPADDQPGRRRTLLGAPTKRELKRMAAAGPTDETLRWVAYAYRVGLILDAKPTQHVEQSFEIPRSTAGRWIAAARDRGYLGKSEGMGRAGG
jgi:hypothetical protein